MSKIYVAFDDNQTGLKNTSKDAFASQNLWVPIERAETNIRIRSNKDTSLVIIRTLFLLILAWGCTVRNVQGIILEHRRTGQYSCVIENFNVNYCKNFNALWGSSIFL